MERLMEGLGRVPLWVWPILVWGIWMGTQAFRVRKVSLVMAALMPVVFLGLSLSSLVGAVAQAPLIGLAWALALGAGGVLGWHFLAQEPLEVHRGKGTVMVPGTWTVLVLFLLIFVTKFVYGTVVEVAPDLGRAPGFLLTVFVLSGLSTGIVTGRTGRLYTHYYEVPVSAQKEPSIR